MTEQKYYFCTFVVIDDGAFSYRSILLDCHPIVYTARYDAVLLNHIEVTKEQYEAHLVPGSNVWG